MLQPFDTIRQRKDLWDLYTRKEEYVPKYLDRHEQFTFTQSEYKEILEPRVSQYIVDNGYTIEYPDHKQFALCLTHDVDELYPPSSHTLRSSLTCLRNGDLRGLNDQVIWKLQGKEKSPYWNFHDIMELEGKYGARSSFYLLATGTDIRRFRYNIEDLEGKLGQIADRGWEVGLHGGYYAFNDLEVILKEKKRLEQILGRRVTGYRNHYLRFKVPESWEILAKAGFGYDTTLGYNEMPGFRNGMCHPFKPYNLNSDREVDILEIPLGVMDITLSELVKSYEGQWRMIKGLIDTVASCHGVLTLNWHSNNFHCPFKRDIEKMYTKILRYGYEQDAWMTNGEEIAQYIRTETS